MRVAYIAPYKGPSLVERRPVVRNLSLSNTIKMELIAKSLRMNSHDVELISQGEVVDPHWRFYPSYRESTSFHPEIPVFYASSLPIRRLNGVWSNMRTLRLFRDRHRASPFDLVIIFNVKGPQLACANYALRRLHLPVILEYEDDVFVNVWGQKNGSLTSRAHHNACRRFMGSVSGCVAVSPYLLTQVSADVPKLLLRGVIGDDLISASKDSVGKKVNRVLFSGTHIKSNGVAELIKAWPAAALNDWELHITGHGEKTGELREMAAKSPGIVFHGLVDRPQLVNLLCSARICINPHAVSQTPGNVFAFKIIEYLATGAHVITTPMGALEKDLEAGITYMTDNSPGTIARTLREIVDSRAYQRNAMDAAHRTYGPAGVSKTLESLIRSVTTSKTARNGG